MIIYKVTNNINGKSYIGQSRFSLERRKQQHKLMYHNSTTPLHVAMRTFGWDNFIWDVVESGNINLDDREVHHMKQYNTVEDGYNRCYRGSGRGHVLRDLILQTPESMVFTSDYFHEYNISRQSISSYVDSGWLERLSRGMYKKKFSTVCVEDLLKTVVEYGDKCLHIGGRTALSYNGVSHYIRFNENIHIFGTENRLPAYFNYFSSEFDYYNRNLFNKPVENIISCQERACLEAIEDTGLDEYENIISGMVGLRPNIMKDMLVSCNSVKTKRIFLHFSDKHNLPWIKNVDIEDIDIGSGKRQIREGGELSKYNIVI